MIRQRLVKTFSEILERSNSIDKMFVQLELKETIAKEFK